MKSSTAFALLCFVYIQFAYGFAYADVIFGVGLTTDDLIAVDSQTGQATPVGAFGFGSVTGLAISSDGRLFAIETAQDQLLEIDKRTGAATVIGSTGIDRISDIAFDEQDRLFGVDTAQDRLLEIDITTGVASDVGLFRFARIAFDDRGNMFATNGGSLRLVDRETLGNTVIGDIGFNVGGGLTYGKRGLFGSDIDNDLLIRINPTTAVGEIVGNYGIGDDVVGLAAQGIPEPSAFIFVPLLGLCVFVRLRYRR